MPMTFDQYSKCSYKCLYCFATYQKSVGVAKKGFLSGNVCSVNTDRVKALFQGLRSDYSGVQFSPYIKQRKVIQWGGMADPFDETERKLGVGLELLRFFRKIDYPICFSTKSTWWLKDSRYTELFKNNKKWNVKFSIVTLNKDKAAKVEMGVDSPALRLKAIGKFAKLNAGGATLRLRPFIIGITNPTHTDLIKHAGQAGATALSTEFFCVETRSNVLTKYRLPLMSKLACMDIKEFYKKFSVTRSGYMRLNRNVKRKFVDEMEAACRAAGMRFYVSDAHFKERCDNGSCCGLSPDWNYSRGQFCEALQICKRNGKVHWSDISSQLDFLKSTEWRQAEGFNTGGEERRAAFWGFSMFDYMHWLWNYPMESGQSPYRLFEGIMKPTIKDKNGDFIYEYDTERE